MEYWCGNEVAIRDNWIFDSREFRAIKADREEITIDDKTMHHGWGVGEHLIFLYWQYLWVLHLGSEVDETGNKEIPDSLDDGVF